MKKRLFSLIAITAMFLAGEIPSWANAGTIKTSTTTWNAGTVVITYQNEVGVTITNTSSISVTIDSLSISGSTEFTTCCIVLPKTIPPHGTAMFNLVFAPTVEGGVSATLTVISTATNKPTVALDGTGFQHQVTLTWNASSSTSDPCWQNIAYVAYRSETSGGSYVPIGSETPYLFYVDTNVISGTTYYYVVVTIADYTQGSSCPGSSASGVQSGYSNMTTATVP